MNDCVNRIEKWKERKTRQPNAIYSRKWWKGYEGKNGDEPKPPFWWMHFANCGGKGEKEEESPTTLPQTTVGLGAISASCILFLKREEK